MELSIVVPLYNERDNLVPLHEELARMLGAAAVSSYEMLFVDDGSTDGSADVLRTIKAGDERVRVFRLARNSGQTAALACGLHQAAGDVVVAIDGDGENDPADIPRLLAKLAEGYDLVSGWRTERWAGARLSRRLPSVAANRLISWMTGVRLHDYGCTLKAYRRDLAHRLMLYGEMHRFVPAIAAEQGARIAEVEVSFRARRAGRSKYGPGRIVRTFLDLLTVKFLSG
ncbi:MAG: glycosyltransferase family 2 protein, partial [Candidatus Binataceae bacterium]